MTRTTSAFGAYSDGLRALATKLERLFALQPPVTAKTLAAVIRKLQFEPDPMLQEAWQVGDGSADHARVFAVPNRLTSYEFLPAMKMLEQRAGLERRAPRYEGYEEPARRDPRIRGGWYQAGWVPFASFGGATMLLISDHSPAPKGKVGQIIAFTHDPDEMTYVADSFATLLKRSLVCFKKAPEELLSEE